MWESGSWEPHNWPTIWGAKKQTIWKYSINFIQCGENFMFLILMSEWKKVKIYIPSTMTPSHHLVGAMQSLMYSVLAWAADQWMLLSSMMEDKWDRNDLTNKKLESVGLFKSQWVLPQWNVSAGNYPWKKFAHYSWSNGQRHNSKKFQGTFRGLLSTNMTVNSL